MKLSLIIVLSLLSFQTFAGQKTTKTNSQQEMERRNNNASVIIGTGSGTASDGYGTTTKDTRPQGKRNADYSDLDLKKKDE